jgi:hypothetical protein
MAVEATSIEDQILQSKMAATINKTAIQTQAIKNATIFPGELQILFTKAAFQQWKIATQIKKIDENNKIIKSFQLSPNATIFIPALQSAFESIPKDPILSLTAPLFLPKPELTETIPTFSAPSASIIVIRC